MANSQSAFKQSDLTKVLRAFRDAGQPMPQIVIERQRIIATPVVGLPTATDPNPWDQP